VLSQVTLVSLKKSIEKTYWHKCTVINFETYIKANKSTGTREVTVIEDRPCKLSYSSLSVATESETVTSITQVPKLFIDLDVKIKPGSRIIITDQQGRLSEYKNSGEPGVFLVHQEIPLKLTKEWA
jgi:hypothetical protein